MFSHVFSKILTSTIYVFGSNYGKMCRIFDFHKYIGLSYHVAKFFLILVGNINLAWKKFSTKLY
ncbi:hypothetical protein C1645_751480, partial [Glomus cerebriforme]